MFFNKLQQKLILKKKYQKEQIEDQKEEEQKNRSFVIAFLTLIATKSNKKKL